MAVRGDCPGAAERLRTGDRVAAFPPGSFPPGCRSHGLMTEAAGRVILLPPAAAV
jgi:hypothetical protein